MVVRLVGIGVLMFLAACTSAPPPQAPLHLPQVVFVPTPPDGLRREAEISCLAKAVYFEARGESDAGMQGVAWVVVNRSKHPKFPDTICGVVQQGGEKPPCQFSWYCDGRQDAPRDKAAWEASKRVARQVFDRQVQDPTKGALYFHHKGAAPSWRDDFKATAWIQSHIYYRPISDSQI